MGGEVRETMGGKKDGREEGRRGDMWRGMESGRVGEIGGETKGDQEKRDKEAGK